MEYLQRLMARPGREMHRVVDALQDPSQRPLTDPNMAKDTSTEWSLRQIVISLFSALTTALPSPLSSPFSSPSSIPNFTTSEAGNPFIDGWYADPDTEIYNGLYYVFPTSSLRYEEQIYLDAFSSPDLVHWTKHPRVLTTENISWAHKALWAPAPIQRDGKYYLYFGANDILVDEIAEGLVGGIGVAVADNPEGPYVDAIGEPLIGDFHNGAQPIDQDVFIDDDGQAYIYYGGHSHANVALLNRDMISLGTFPDNTTFKEITPTNYVEGSQMVKRNGVYYLMWSEGGWTGPDYSVSYAMSDSPLGPFDREARILQQDAAVARGSGHNAVINVPGTDVWYILYHRRPLSETDGNHRVVCYDRMYFDEDGRIQQVHMLVKDDFSDGEMIAWTASREGEWSVQDEKLLGTATQARGFAMLDTNFTDFVFDATVSSSDLLTASPLLIFHASGLQDGEQYYFAKLRPDGIEIGLMTEEAETVLEKAAVAFDDGIEYRIRVTVEGEVIRAFVDDWDISVRVAQTALLWKGESSHLTTFLSHGHRMPRNREHSVFVTVSLVAPIAQTAITISSA